MASSLLSNANTEQLLDTLWQYCDVFATWCQDHEHLAAKTVFLVSPGEGIDAKFNDAADAVGMDAETVKASKVLDFVPKTATYELTNASSLVCPLPLSGLPLGIHPGKAAWSSSQKSL
jgi:hypothetical protein